ncbi:MAG: putative toxin-antitoxin system toxin component, PIN family [Rectinemataceae bacterium]
MSSSTSRAFETQRENSLRFLVDTNILISAALFPSGKVAVVFSHILESHTLVISSYSLSECTTVFAKKFPDKKVALEAFLKETHFELYQTAQEIKKADFPSIRDSKDLPILASAILAEVDILLTGDKDFQGLSLKRPLVFSPSAYFDLIQN